MKLRNKKTGEIVEATDFNIISDYASLAELNEEWEDYEEHYWYVFANAVMYGYKGDVLEDNFKETGNYFETKEQAEKAVEKLKAWKRLKDKGFKFTDINDTEESQSMIYECGILCKFNMEHRLSADEDFILLFGDKI